MVHKSHFNSKCPTYQPEKKPFNILNIQHILVRYLVNNKIVAAYVLHYCSCYIFVPEMCIAYFSESCTFLICSVSVSTAVWRGGDCAPPLFCHVDFILYACFTNPPQDGANGKSTKYGFWALKLLEFWALKSLRSCY